MTAKASLPKINSLSIRTGQTLILAHYILRTIPGVKKELRRWRHLAAACPDPVLATQALNSLRDKDFHCYGGAVFALEGKGAEAVLIELISAYQTICDYLDNLCDRADCLDGKAFRQLHLALIDALQSGATSDYYAFYPHREDGGYLAELVAVCRNCLTQLPSYAAVRQEVLPLVNLYIELQVKKHIDWEKRELDLISWAKNEIEAQAQAEALNYRGIYWQEFAAASGSTLAVFALFALAAREEISTVQVQAISNTYFPWICGLHILLDYFIDREEDRQGGDLNFTFYYPNETVMGERLKHFIHQSQARLNHLENPAFTRTVVEGLLAMYLSDAKVKQQKLQATARALLHESGSGTWHVYRLCALVRRFF